MSIAERHVGDRTHLKSTCGGRSAVKSDSLLSIPLCVAPAASRKILVDRFRLILRCCGMESESVKTVGFLCSRKSSQSAIISVHWVDSRMCGQAFDWNNRCGL